MRKMLNRLAMIGLLAVLSACNSTDALTPQVDVGGGVIPSSAVTERDIEAVSADTSPVGTAQQTALMGQTESRAEIATTTALTSPSGGEDTAGSLQAQADALSRNQQSAAATVESTTQRQAAATQTTAEATRETAALPTASGESLRFLPIIGAPVKAVTPLSKRLGAEARASGLTIKSSSDASSRHILKGYFSAVADNGKTTVIYVWDVLDNSGARLHRIQGQDSVSTTAADPWTVVPARTMEGIAQRTIGEYLAWSRQNRG